MPCRRPLSATAMLCKQTEEMLRALLHLFIFLILWSLHRALTTLNASVRRLASHERLLLSTPDITLIRCNSLNPETPLPFLKDEYTHNCVLLTDHLLFLAMVYRNPLWIMLTAFGFQMDLIWKMKGDMQ